MSKKEELSKAFIKSFILKRNKYLNESNWEFDLGNIKFSGSDVQNAFEAGLDSSIENIECVVKWNNAKRTLPEFNEDNNAVICIADDNYVSLQRGKLADKTKLWCWLSDILPVVIL